MCTGYYLENSKALKGIVQAAAGHRLRRRMMEKIAQPLVTQGEVSCGDIVPAIAPDSRGVGRVFPMVWGFTGKHALITELPVETLEYTKSPILLDAWALHRCLIPTSWYFEWERLRPVISYDSFGDQTPEGERRERIERTVINETGPDGSVPVGDRFMIQTRGSSVTMLAGIYRIEEVDDVRIPHFLILTQEAFGDLCEIHDRMPVIFDTSDRETIQSWVDPGAIPSWDVERVAEKAIDDVIFEKSPPVRKKRDFSPF